MRMTFASEASKRSYWTEEELFEFFVDYEFPCLSLDVSTRKDERVSNSSPPFNHPDTYSPQTKPETDANVAYNALDERERSFTRDKTAGNFPFGTFCRRGNYCGKCTYECGRRE